MGRSRFATLLVALVAAVLVLTASVPVVTAAYPGSNGLIAFVGHYDDGYDVSIMHPDGTGQMRLHTATSTAGPTTPSFSADGRRIAYGDHDNRYIWVIDADGSGEVSLAPTEYTVFDPSWSPDGSRVAFGFDAGMGPHGLGAVSPDGSEVALFELGLFPTSTAWSPDGTRIAFGTWSFSGGGGGVAVINPDGTGLTTLLAGLGESPGSLSWSPDGARLAYAFAGQIWVVNADGSDPTYLGPGTDVSWSPDGTKFAYTCAGQICVMDADGTGSVQLTTVGNITQPSGGGAPASTYAFSGFFQPVDNAALNVARAGSAIPVKFSLGGDQGLDIFADGYPKAVTTDCATGTPSDAIETYTAGNSGLTYDAASDRYTYVWKTAKAWAGCRQLQVRFDDGSMHTANFKFK